MRICARVVQFIVLHQSSVNAQDKLLSMMESSASAVICQNTGTMMLESVSTVLKMNTTIWMRKDVKVVHKIMNIMQLALDVN